jgi:hypothetical protein
VSSSTGSGGGTITALAVLNKDLPKPLTSSMGMIDPDALVLIWSNQAVTCAAPEVEENGCGGFSSTWWYSIALPPAIVQVGSVALHDSSVYTDTWQSPNGCPSMEGFSFGAATVADTTFQVVAVDDTTLTVSLPSAWSPEPQWGFPAIPAGMQTIPRCQPLGDAGSPH